MADKWMRIAITPECEHPAEVGMIKAILDAGWDYVHLRHPGASLRDMKRLIEAIPQNYHNRLRLHGHFELVYEFNLGGVHLNRRCPSVPAGYHGGVSRSCHTVAETLTGGGEEYVTLSPVFDSVSKTGYRSGFTADELMVVPVGRVVALGGVTPDRVKALRQYPFMGYAVLGYLFGASGMRDFMARLREFDN